MPTNNPRVNVTLRPEQYVLVSRLAKAQGRSRSAVLTELLETVAPVLERVCVAVEAAQRAQDQARVGLRESVTKAEAAILPHVNAALGQFDWLLAQVALAEAPAAAAPAEQGAPPAVHAPARRSGPRSVTRGPATGGRPPHRTASAIAAAVLRGPAGRKHK